MARLDVLAYNGVITYNDERYPFRAAARGDAEELAGMYAGVSINRNNYREKLKPGSEDFSKTGGIFAPLNEHEILDEMTRSLFGVILAPAVGIAAMLWVSPEDPAFDGQPYAEDETHIFARDIIIRTNVLPSLGKLMYYTIFRALRGMGFAY